MSTKQVIISRINCVTVPISLSLSQRIVAQIGLNSQSRIRFEGKRECLEILI